MASNYDSEDDIVFGPGKIEELHDILVRKPSKISGRKSDLGHYSFHTAFSTFCGDSNENIEKISNSGISVYGTPNESMNQPSKNEVFLKKLNSFIESEDNRLDENDTLMNILRGENRKTGILLDNIHQTLIDNSNLDFVGKLTESAISIDSTIGEEPEDSIITLSDDSIDHVSQEEYIQQPIKLEESSCSFQDSLLESDTNLGIQKLSLAINEIEQQSSFEEYNKKQNDSEETELIVEEKSADENEEIYCENHFEEKNSSCTEIDVSLEIAEEWKQSSFEEYNKKLNDSGDIELNDEEKTEEIYIRNIQEKNLSCAEIDVSLETTEEWKQSSFEEYSRKQNDSEDTELIDEKKTEEIYNEQKNSSCTEIDVSLETTEEYNKKHDSEEIELIDGEKNEGKNLSCAENDVSLETIEEHSYEGYSSERQLEESLKFNDTIEEMDRALKYGLDYEMSPESSSITINSSVTPSAKNKQTGIPKLKALHKKANKYDNIISPVATYIKSPAPSNFKVPQIPFKKVTTPMRKNPVPKHIISPVGYYIKESVHPLQENRSVKTLSSIKTSPQVVPSSSANKENFVIPKALYTPGRPKIISEEKPLTLPASIRSMVGDAVIGVHDHKTNRKMEEFDLSKQLQDADLTTLNNSSQLCDESFIKNTHAFIK